MTLLFLKLGGSLITDKDKPFTSRKRLIKRIAKEIYLAKREKPGIQLIIGHGSGSFGHTVAHQYKTRSGVKNDDDWWGFVQVWKEARRLNQIVVESLISAGIPAISFPPSAIVISEDFRVKLWDIQPIQSALEHGLVPLIYGDVVFDKNIGGTILSTEDLFMYLAPLLQPNRILLAGEERGVWMDYPERTQLIPKITPKTIDHFRSSLFGASWTDVTGGMSQKVTSMLDLATQNQGCEIIIFSGSKPNVIKRALLGESPGTVICES